VFRRIRVTNARVYYHYTRGCGCAGTGIPHASLWANEICKPRRNAREKAKVRGNNPRRRPGLEPGPITQASAGVQKSSNSAVHNKRHGVAMSARALTRGPAFAGTTSRGPRHPVNPAVTSFVYASPTIGPSRLAAGVYRCVMLRFKILASAVPLLIVAFFARGGLSPGARPCIAIGDTSVEMPRCLDADLHVAFTDDPALATVRVQLSDNAETADFVMIDDVDAPEAAAASQCATKMVSSRPPRRRRAGDLSFAGRPADYRIFVRSKSFSAREAAPRGRRRQWRPHHASTPSL